jgi:hypothetical protein
MALACRGREGLRARDTDIYGVTPGEWESHGRLLATTGNVLSNLKKKS